MLGLNECETELYHAIATKHDLKDAEFCPY